MESDSQTLVDTSSLEGELDCRTWREAQSRLQGFRCFARISHKRSERTGARRQIWPRRLSDRLSCSRTS